jgi:hypothetical protein
VGSDLIRFFSRMGARLKLLEGVPVSRRWNVAQTREQSPRIVVDIRRDKLGEYFEIRTAPGAMQEIVVLNVQPREKHCSCLAGAISGQAEVPVRSRREALVRSSNSRKRTGEHRRRCKDCA